MKAKKRKKLEMNALKQAGGKNGDKLSHDDWCKRNFISARSLDRAHDVRQQLVEICSRGSDLNGLGIDTSESCEEDEMKYCTQNLWFVSVLLFLIYAECSDSFQIQA